MLPDETEARVAVKVLVIGAEPSRLGELSRRLVEQGFICDTASTSPAGLRGGLLRSPDVIVAVEVAGGWQPARHLLQMGAAQLRGEAPPVLVVADGVTPTERADAMASQAAGVMDWVESTTADREIAARLMHLARWRRLAADNEDLRRRCAGLETVDQLTGLPNHRALQEFLSMEFRRAERYASPLSLILFDIDRFRSLNETHGHQWGDAILLALARGIRALVREVDMAARYGGEEFALLLPETDQDAALMVAARVRAMAEGVTAASAAAPESPSRITLSAGVATYPDEGAATRGLLLSCAEAALRRAKDEGRNRVIAHAAPGKQAAAMTERSSAGGDPAADSGSGWSG